MIKKKHQTVLFLLVIFCSAPFLIETIDPSIIGDESLFAGVEWVAVTASIDPDLIESRFGLERITTRDTSHLALMIVRMYSFFHAFTPSA
jgi:hypothetical protein